MRLSNPLDSRAARAWLMRAIEPQNMVCTGSVVSAFFERNHELNIGQILLQPTADACVQIVQVLEDDSAFGFLVKSKNGVAAEFLHGLTDPPAGFAGHEVAVKGFA